MNLTDVSREYYKCFQQTRIPKIHLSAQSKSMLKQIYRAIWSPIQSTIQHETEHVDIAAIRHHCTGSPAEVQAEIKQMNHAHHYTLSIGSRKVEVYFVQHARSLDFCRKAIQKIERWLSYILSICPARCAQTLHIYLFLTEHKKRFPYTTGGAVEPISQEHANTAFTTSCSTENKVCIYRKEEWFKVLLHESFHCLGLDFSESNVTESNRQIVTIFPRLDPATDIRLFETYCEMWAEMINLMFLCGPGTVRCKTVAYKSKRRKTQKSVAREAGFRCVIRLLKFERMYSIYGCSKLLKHYGLKYTDLFESKEPVYKENTNAFSYYVVKSIWMWNINEFLHWCFVHNRKRHSLEFDQTKVAEYGKLVEELCRDRAYIEVMNTDFSGVEKCSASLEHTMRMCLFETA